MFNFHFKKNDGTPLVANVVEKTPRVTLKEYLAGTTTLKQIFISGIILGFFHPPVIGFVYALCFAFKKETRRIALYIALWTIVWTITYAFIFGFSMMALKNSGAFSVGKTMGVPNIVKSTVVPTSTSTPRNWSTR